MSPSQLLAWYLTPWLRINRATFNVAVFLITLPAFILGLADTADTVNTLATTMADPQTGLTGLLGTLQPPAPAPGYPWGDLGNLLLMLAMAPLIAARARDIGLGTTTIKIVTALALASCLPAALSVLILPTFGLSIPAAILSGVVLAWLCLKGSAPRAERTNPANPAILRRDDTDYPNPFG